MIHGSGSEQAFCLAREQKGRGGPHATHHRVRPRIVLTAQASRQTSSRRSVSSSLAESGTGEDKAGPVGREWKSVRNSARNSSLTGSVAAPERPFSPVRVQVPIWPEHRSRQASRRLCSKVSGARSIHTLNARKTDPSRLGRSRAQKSLILWSCVVHSLHRGLLASRRSALPPVEDGLFRSMYEESLLVGFLGTGLCLPARQAKLLRGR